MERFISPLRYPGGKGKIYSDIKKIIIENKFNDHIYVEPFAGGAAIPLKLLSEGVINKVVINDFDKSIFALWYSILNHTDELINKILNTSIDLQNWFFQKDIQKNKEEINDLVILGFSTLFLNRTNRSGVINGGPIGGKKQTGKYLIDCRFNKGDIIRRIKFISKYKDQISIFNSDASVFLTKLNQTNTKYFINMDPPYYVKGKQLYMNYFKHEDHEYIKNIIADSEHPWIITYDNVQEIKNIYLDFNMLEFDLTYSAGKTKKGKEILIYSPLISLPYNLFK